MAIFFYFYSPITTPESDGLSLSFKIAFASHLSSEGDDFSRTSFASQPEEEGEEEEVLLLF
jgi:hypothetical protein